MNAVIDLELCPAAEKRLRSHIGVATEESLASRLFSTSDESVGNSAHVSAVLQRLSSQTCVDISRVELLSLILGFVYSWSDAEAVARQLLDRFGSLGAVMAVSHLQLSAAIPDADPCFALLKVVHHLLGSLLREPIEAQISFRNMSELHDYLRLTLAHEKVETVRLLFLNTRNMLIKDELHSKGTVNHTPLYPRELVRRVIEVQASALIIVHNHPSGDPTPSKEDVSMTKVLEDILNKIDVVLHDHVVVGKHRCVSMRQLGYIGARP